MQQASLTPEARHLMTRCIRHTSGWWLVLNTEVVLDDALWNYVEYHGAAIMSIADVDGQRAQFGARFANMLKSHSTAWAHRVVSAFGTRDPATWFTTVRYTSYEGRQVVLNPLVVMSEEAWAYCATIVVGNMAAGLGPGQFATSVAEMLRNIANDPNLPQVKTVLQAFGDREPATWFIGP